MALIKCPYCGKEMNINQYQMKKNVKSIMAVMSITALFLGLSSCGGGTSKDVLTSKDVHIRHTQDWTEYVASATTIKEIDDGLKCIPEDVFMEIYGDLSDKIIYSGKTNDYETKNDCRSIWWLCCYVPHIDDEWTNEQKERFNENGTLLVTAISMCIGDKTMTKMLKMYVEYKKTGNNQQLYY